MRRYLLALLAGIGCLVLLVAGGAFAAMGVGEQRAIDRSYTVRFAVPETGCGVGVLLTLNVEDGKILRCTMGYDGLPGFTDEQDEAVLALARELGAGGLSAADQQAIQARVDSFAARVPRAERPYGDQLVAGRQKSGLGAIMVVAAIFGFVLIVRTIRR